MLGAIALAFSPVIVAAQTAAILPNARTQFIDANGQPVVGGTVGFYIPSTTTPKATWQDSGETTPNTNPVILDGLGTALIWGSGSYREILKDNTGSVIWDGLTTSPAAASGGGTVTSITCGTGLIGGTITLTGTCSLDLSRVFTTSLTGLVPASGGGTTNFLRADGTFAAPPTAGGAALLASSNTFTQFNEFSAGTATCNCVFVAFEPTNFGVGHPALSWQKDLTANSWTLGLFDGASNAGTIRFSAATVGVSQGLTVGGGETIAGALSVGSTSTIAGSAICTMSSGCTGGGGGGGYATVYDVAATYGGDPTGAADNVTAFNNALAACAGSNGGIIWFQAGQWRFNSGIDDNVQGCSIQGVGQQATNFYYYGSSGNLLTIDAYSAGVQGIGFFNGGSWTSGFALAVGVNSGASLATYNNLFFSGIPGFIYLSGASESKFTNIYGVDPTGTDAYRCDGAGFSQVFGSRWSNVQVGYQSTNTTTNSFHMGSGCNSWALSQAGSSGAVGGSGLACLVVDSGADFLFANDLECDHSVNGVLVNGGTGLQFGANDWFGSTLSGNGITFGSGFSGFATITGAHIRDNSAYGVLINGSGGVQVVGNVISGNASGNVAVGSNVNNFQINSNTLGVPGDPTATYGVLVNTGSSDRYTIVGNVCGANNTNGVIDGGSGGHKSVGSNAC